MSLSHASSDDCSSAGMQHSHLHISTKFGCSWPTVPAGTEAVAECPELIPLKSDRDVSMEILSRETLLGKDSDACSLILGAE